MNVNLFKSKVIAHGYTTMTFIKKMNESKHFMTLQTYYKKINGKSEFTQNEINRIKKILELSPEDVSNIFFDSLYRKGTKNEKN